jgi:hypothetical protein
MSLEDFIDLAEEYDVDTDVATTVADAVFRGELSFDELYNMAKEGISDAWDYYELVKEFYAGV